MEWCRPVPADEAEALAARCPELTLRAEPAHQEAFLKIGDGQIGGADWEVVSRSLEAWSERQPDILPADLGLRIPISPAKQGRIPIKTSRSRLPVDHADTAVVQAESLTKRFGEVAAVICVGGWDDHGLSRPERRWQDDDAADDPGAGGADEWTSTSVRSSLRGVAACGVADWCRARGDRFPSRPFGPRSPADARAGRRCS